MNITDLIALPFQWGASIRGKRFFHPVGVLAEGSIERIAPANKGLPLPSSDVVARVSKAVGMPGPVPDVIGLALRVPGQDAAAKPWDMLLVSAGSSVLGRAIALRPVASWTAQTMTSLMPLRYQGKNWWLRARIATDINGLGLSLDSVRARIEDGGIELTIGQACGTAEFSPLARVTLRKVATHAPHGDVSFDPVLNTAPRVTLYPGWLAGLRRSAYARSREGREHAVGPAGLPAGPIT